MCSCLQVTYRSEDVFSVGLGFWCSQLPRYVSLVCVCVSVNPCIIILHATVIDYSLHASSRKKPIVAGFPIP